ncbi:MAG: BatA and WFA domain-containing protein [Planctomycetota bacterium]
MSFLTAALGGLVAVIAVPTLVILYFLKLRRRDVTVSSTLLWKKAIEDMRADAPFQKLRRNILLLLQLLALAVLCLALAQPVWDAGGGESRRHIIMIDRSASMNATDGDEQGSTRLSRAIGEARRLVEGFRDPGPLGTSRADEAMLIVFDASAEVREQFTTNRAVLLAALERITPTDSPGDVEDAFRLAQAHAPRRIYFDENSGRNIELEGLTAGEPATVHLFSDGRLTGAAEALPRAGDEVVYYQIGDADTGNIGITALRAERGFEAPAELTIFVGLQSTFAGIREVDIELSILDGPSLVRRVTVPGAISVPGAQRAEPGGAGVVFELERGQASRVTATIVAPEPDALASDDEGWLVVPAARSARVVFVTTGNVFLEAALNGLPLEELAVIAPGDFEPGMARDYDVVVFDGLEGIGRDLPPGRHLVLGGVPAPVEFDAGGEGTAVILDWTAGHAAMRDVRLTSLVMAGLPAVSEEAAPAEGWAMTVLAESDRGPAIFELVGPSSRSIVTAFDPAASNWPFDVSFVVFLASAVGDLAGPEASVEAELRPGDVLRGRVAAGVSSASIVPPAGGRTDLIPSDDGSFAFGPLARAGVYEVETGDSSQAFAVNLLSPEESDIGSEAGLGLASVEVEGRDPSTVAGAIVGWRWLVLACLVVLLFEWWVYNRRVRL